MLVKCILTGCKLLIFSQKCVNLRPIVYLPPEAPLQFSNNPCLQVFQDDGIRLVYHRTVQGGEIDACGFFRVMPHAFADD